MMQTIPLAAVPSQTLTVILGGQNCKIAIYQKTEGLFLDLSVSGSSIVSGVICEDRIKLVRYDYLGFAGDLAFVDMQGTLNPYYTGFGTRYKLVYIP